jgi:hypothetical protein
VHPKRWIDRELGGTNKKSMPDLTPLETEYTQKFLDLFALVDASRPEKGINAILTRVREEVALTGQPLAPVLEKHYHAAKQRTLRRLVLIKQCSLKQISPPCN